MRDIEKYTDDYNKPNYEDYTIVYRRRKILEILNQYKPQSILEIGCGMEPLFKYIEFDYKKYTIVDPSRVFYENAVSLAEGDARIQCYQGFFPLEGENLEGNDFIVCSGLLHEVEEPLVLLKGIANICDDKTIVHVNVPNAYSFHRILAVKMKLIEDVHEFSKRNKLYQQHNVYDMKTLSESLDLCGFEVVNSGSYFLKPFTHTQMYEMISKGIIDEHVLDGLYEMIDCLPDMGSEIFVNCKLKRC